MGGRGSGNWYRWDSKPTTESQHRIDIRWLHKHLRPGATGTFSWPRREKETGSIGFRIEADRMILNYRRRSNGGEWEDVEQSISFDRTPCNYGGHRTWFLCPLCWNRAAVLYGAGKYFYCRRCHGLTYSTQKENRADRLLSKAQKIRWKLGGGALAAPFPRKPKHMHWKTYWRLLREAVLAEKMGWGLVGRQLGIGS